MVRPARSSSPMWLRCSTTRPFSSPGAESNTFLAHRRKSRPEGRLFRWKDLVRGGAVVVDALLNDATASPVARCEDEHRHEQTEDTDDHENDAERLDADAGQRRVNGEGENRAESD